MIQDHDTIVNLLKKSRYLKPFGEAKIRQLAVISKRQTIERGKVLLRQDEPNRNVYIIIQGSVSVFVDKQFVYTLCRSGDILGEMSVITGGPSNATIAADVPVDLIEIPSQTLKQIHGDAAHELHAALYQWFSSILTDKLYKISQKAKRFEQVSRRLQLDLEEAKTTQDKIFLSQTRRIDRFPMTLKCEFSNILGGDFYAVFPVDDEAFGILIGDVSGHGTGACIISMMIFNLFLAFARKESSATAVVEKVNGMSLEFMHQGKFATLFYGIYRPGSRTLTYTNAGHHPALVFRNGETKALPTGTGIPVGILNNRDQGYQEYSFTFVPGDRLLLFTDAVFETDPQSHTGGFSGLIRYLEKIRYKSARAVAEDLYHWRKGFSPAGLNDDYTLMIFDQL